MKLIECTEKDVASAWGRLREVRPLVFHVTNAVAVALQANVCLSVGASPLMSQYPAEAEELTDLAQGFLVNLGTPTDAAWKTVRRALAQVKQTGKCFTLLDPVGYGASRCRNESTDTLLREHTFSIVKGNAGEISLLAGTGGATKGVDVLAAGNLEKGVLALARGRHCVACTTGEVDFMSDGEAVACVTGGSALLPGLSGSGCAAGTVILSVVAACGHAVLGTLAGLLAMGIASERAEKNCAGPGSFPSALIDQLSRLVPEDFQDSCSRWCARSPSCGTEKA